MNKAIYFSRFAIFIIYFWFGILKVVGMSPASPLALSLMDKTLPFMEPALFLVLLGLFEMLIGTLFLIPRLDRPALGFLAIHMLMVCSPLLLLPALTWVRPFVPTLEGQYIIKNILIIALALNIAFWRKASQFVEPESSASY